METMPPLGLKPRKIHDRDRMNEIISAIERYSEATMPIPKEWTDELRLLAHADKAFFRHESSGYYVNFQWTAPWGDRIFVCGYPNTTVINNHDSLLLYGKCLYENFGFKNVKINDIIVIKVGRT